jgi:2-methylcitrate dehydratase PrpD
VTLSVADNQLLPSSRLLVPLRERCDERAGSATVRSAAARSLFDYCGCVVSASSTDCSWACEHAGRLSVAAHVRDQDDLHHGSITHPGGVVWSAVIATGLDREVTWEEGVRAAVLGYELVVRLAEGLPGSHRQHWHATAVAGTIGAAAAAAIMLGGSDQAVLDAIGHASSVASGSAQAQFERTETRLVHRAVAAATGVLCARAAVAGLAGNKWGLQGGRGALSSVSTTVSEALGRVHDSLALEETGFRLYPVNGFAHAAVEAAGSLGPVDAGEIEHVTVTLAPPAATALASNRAPETDEDAWWSVEHAVALALTGGGPDAVAAGLTERDDVLGICARTRLRARDEGWGATVEVAFGDGERRAASVNEPAGHMRRPATDGDLCDKWQRLTGSDGSRFLERLATATPTSSLASIIPPPATMARQ